VLKFFSGLRTWTSKRISRAACHAFGMTGNRHKGRRGKALQLAECPVDTPSHVRQSDVIRNTATMRLAGANYLPGFNSGCRCE
jgi:hypothetical protein